MTSSKPIYFLHIPKTAGTTFNYAVLPQRFRSEEICPAWCYNDLLKLPAGQMASYRCFRGHFYYLLHNLLPAPPLYMTFLRDPIERIISNYEFVRRCSVHFAHERVCAMSGFLEFAWSDLTPPNFQVRALTMEMEPAEFLRLCQDRCGGNHMDVDAAVVQELLKAAPTAEDLELAKRRLSDFFFVGIAERFRDSVELLFRTVGWGPVGEFTNLNVTPAAERLRLDELPQSEINAMLDYHRLDVELYRYAVSLFEKRWAAS